MSENNDKRRKLPHNAFTIHVRTTVTARITENFMDEVFQKEFLLFLFHKHIRFVPLLLLLKLLVLYFWSVGECSCRDEKGRREKELIRI